MPRLGRPFSPDALAKAKADAARFDHPLEAQMNKSAVLLMDLQKDFLDGQGGRTPVDGPGAEAVLRVANDVLAKRFLGDALPILVVNQFPNSDRIANFFRKRAAIAGTAGAEIDARLKGAGSTKVIVKARASAFSNPELDKYLRAEGVGDLHLLGVFAEGCVRSTAIAAIKRGYSVHVLENAVASSAVWKKRFALWVMKRAGAGIDSLR
jgi:nicotinamidase-related amidase